MSYLGQRYFGQRYFSQNYLGGTGEVVVVTPETSPGGGVDLRYGDKDYGWKAYIEQLERDRQQALSAKIAEITQEKQSVPIKPDFVHSAAYQRLSEQQQQLISEIMVLQQLEYELKLKQAWNEYLEDEALAILLLIH